LGGQCNLFAKLRAVGEKVANKLSLSSTEEANDHSFYGIKCLLV